MMHGAGWVEACLVSSCGSALEANRDALLGDAKTLNPLTKIYFGSLEAITVFEALTS